MKILASIIITILLFASTSLFAKTTTERFALIIGANNGGKVRVKLAFAHSDAKSFSKVLKELGGINSNDQVTLFDPSDEEINTAFEKLKNKIKVAKSKNKQTQILFYYSGHSNENGLLLGERQLKYKKLKTKLKDLNSDVQITILDSCASGAMIRQKGGKWRPSFLSDKSSLVNGHAILTSSSANEAAQESNRIGGSFFTHYMISGLRGAADRSNDKKVTLNEAYEYAFHKTLKRTQGTIAGPQHPNYDFQLAGSGDLVLTDLRSTSSLLVFKKDLLGKFFIRNKKGNLIAEIDKTDKKEFSFGLEPGTYNISLKNKNKLKTGSIKLAKNQSLTIKLSSLKITSQEATVSRGDNKPATYNNRKELKHIPFSVGLLPGTSMNSMSDKKTLNNFSFGLIIDDGYATEGISFSDIGSIKTGWLRGVQLGGLFNILGGNLDGLQIAGIFNIANSDIKGLQVAGIFNAVKNNSKGLQVAGIFNTVKNNSKGLQVAGILNKSKDIEGIQVAGIFNKAENVKGIQISGILNRAKNVKGIQIGLINIADDSTFSIGLINIIKNGRFKVASFISSEKEFLIEIKNGGSYWHMIYGLGSELENEDMLRLELGFGFHIPFSELVSLDIDFIQLDKFDTNKNIKDYDWNVKHNSLRLQFGMKINNYISIITGASLNIHIQPGDKKNLDKFWGKLVKDAKENKDSYDVYLYPGFNIGLQFL